ncbi:MAG: DUF3465 domain-containing protein [Methylococcaceae bacterium]|jgi:hypothetical protein
MKKLLLIALILLLGFSYLKTHNIPLTNDISFQEANPTEVGSDEIIAQAFANQVSDVQVAGQGIVVKMLSDDLKGRQHQRFIIKLGTGQTLLVAHNIDLAPRLDNLQIGDTVQFNGVYEWGEKGGLIHWTHRDPNGSHPAGWLKFQGKTYQ